MPRQFSRSVTFRGRVARRATEWLGREETAVVTLPFGSVIFDSSLSTAEKAKRPFTIVRTRGSLFVGSDQAAAQEHLFGSMGMSVVSEQAAGIGVTALPLPGTDVQSDLFFVYESFASAMRTATDQSGVLLNFDSKAMRKVEEGQDVAVVLENASPSAGFLYLIQFRMLIKVA